MRRPHQRRHWVRPSCLFLDSYFVAQAARNDRRTRTARTRLCRAGTELSGSPGTANRSAVGLAAEPDPDSAPTGLSPERRRLPGKHRLPRRTRKREREQVEKEHRQDLLRAMDSPSCQSNEGRSSCLRSFRGKWCCRVIFLRPPGWPSGAPGCHKRPAMFEYR